MTTAIEIEPGEEYVFRLGGRTVHLWAHSCETCASLDVWTDRGRDDETVSMNTGDTSRAAVGVARWRNGRRYGGSARPEAGSASWPAYSTVNLIWDPEP